MADPDCPICEASGYRSCDVCGGVVFEAYLGALGVPRDLCAYCIGDLEEGALKL